MVKSHTQKRKSRKSAKIKTEIARPRRRATTKRAAKPPSSIMMNPAERLCAQHYAETVMDPFDTPEGACLPVLPCLDSAKRKIFARGTGLIQANGFGGIMATTSLTHDSPCVLYTNGMGTGNTLAGTDPTTAVQRYSNSELSNSDFTSLRVQGRVVGCGLRVRYTGKQIDMNGTIYAFEEPSHLDCGNLTVQDLEGFDKVKPQNFNREWTVVTWQPVLPSESAYSTDPYAKPYANYTNPIVILIQVQGLGQGEGLLPFQWEWYLHYEAIGSGARGKSHTHMAPMAGPNVIAALQKAPTSMFDDVSNKKVSKRKISSAMVDLGSSFVADLGKAAISTIGGSLGPIGSSLLTGAAAALAA